MDATQILDFDDEELNNNTPKRAVGFLKVFAVGDFPETLFPVYEGENIVGRHDNCDITIPLQAVSKKHACIDVHGKNHLICDYNSRNKTQRNQMFLKPLAFYELVNEVELMFADVKCHYLFAQPEDEVDKEISDSGSETASESMMPKPIEDDEQEVLEEKIASSAPNNIELDESMEQTQNYTYKNPETDDDETDNDETDNDETGDDDETDDEKDVKNDATASGINSSSFATEQTSLQNSPSIEATMQYGAASPDTVDSIPETPFLPSSEQAQPFKLKRAVDVKVDTTRRVSAGNTLAYGLSTLESPNSTRESMDASECTSAKEELSGERCTSTTEVKNKLLFENVEGQECSNNDGECLPDSFSRQEKVPDDLMETQLYEPWGVPESPEFLQDKSEPFGETVREAKVISEIEKPGDISEERSFRYKTSEVRISADEISAAKTLGDKTLVGKTYENESFVVRKPDDDTLEETQAYGLPKDEEEFMATQAYGPTFDSDSATLDTGDELVATQAYGIRDDIQVPDLSGVFKVPGAMNTQDMSEGLVDRERGGKESTAGNENEGVKLFGSKEYFDEMEIQPTQNYIENQDSNNENLSKIGLQGPGETSESSDGTNMPSLARMMGLKSDSDSDFIPTRQHVEKRMDIESPSTETTKTDIKNSSSIVIEGQNSLSTEKRCYVECPADEPDQIDQEKVHNEKSSSGRKTPARGRRKQTARRGRIQKGTMEDRAEHSTTPAKDDGLNEDVNSLIKGGDALLMDTDEQLETTVAKRGKGRANRGRKSTVTTRNSRGKKVDTIMKEFETKMMEDTMMEEVLPKGRKNTRKRNQCENNTGDEEDSEIFKLQISAVDSPETEDFVSDKKYVRQAKKLAQRGKKGFEGKLESTCGSETKIALDKKQPEPEEKGSVTRKSARKSTASKNLNVNERDNNEKKAKEQEEMIESNKVSHKSNQKTDPIGASTRKRRDKRGMVSEDKGLPRTNKDSTSMDNEKQAEVTSIGEDEKKENNGKGIEYGSKSLRESTSTVAKRLRSGDDKTDQNFQNCQDEINEQANIMNESEIKERGRTTIGRGKKRKSSENLNDKVKETKGSGKKSHKKTVTEDDTEIQTETKEDETQLSREKTASMGNDTLKSDTEESELSSPAASLSKRASSGASTASTSKTTGRVPRSTKKGKQAGKSDNEVSVVQTSTVKVIFTGVQDEAILKAKKIVQSLGGKVVERLEDCTHLVTNKVRRTVKLLCAICRGIPVVDMVWLDASKKSKSFLDCSEFILNDEEAQKKFSFSMKRSLELARDVGLLDGYKVFVTSNIRPPPEEMKEIIKSAKGEVVTKMPTSRDNDVIVLSCDEDKELCQKAHVDQVYTAELLLTGILRQELDLKQHKLALNNSPESAKPKRRRKR